MVLTNIHSMPMIAIQRITKKKANRNKYQQTIPENNMQQRTTTQKSSNNTLKQQKEHRKEKAKFSPHGNNKKNITKKHCQRHNGPRV